MARASEKRHWDRFWSSSPELADVYTNDGRVVAFLVSRMDVAGKRILEVGAGTGRDGLELVSCGADVWSLDFSEASLSLIHAVAGERLKIVCGDALSLPFADASFDVVFHQGLLEHFRAPLDLLRENHRVLKSGGFLLVDVPQRYHYYTLLKHALMAMNRWFAGWETEFTAGELRFLCERAGFAVEAAYGRNLFPPVWYRAARRLLLKARVRLPMYPLSGPAVRRLRERWRAALPPRVTLATSMAIGVLGRKA